MSNCATLAPPGPDVKVRRTWTWVGLPVKPAATTLIFEKLLTFTVPIDFCVPVGIVNWFWETLAGNARTVGIAIMYGTFTIKDDRPLESSTMGFPLRPVSA